jgi:endonuclease-3 related protein
MYRLLETRYGDLGWWPARTDFEVMVGAILTQNTSWGNVEKAILGLRAHRLLSPKKMHSVPKARLSRIIKPSGYFRIKADRVKELTRFIMEKNGGDLIKMKKMDPCRLRAELLEVKGIGNETADAILLYALDMPFFVVDAYTKRIFSRHGLISVDASYADVQSLVHDNFPKDIRKYNQFHALIVETGKRYCKKRVALCEECPLGIVQSAERMAHGGTRHSPKSRALAEI